MQMINFGCGLSVAPGWKNYDASPTLRLQRIPLLGRVAQSLIKPRFPTDAIYGDVVHGLQSIANRLIACIVRMYLNIWLWMTCVDPYPKYSES
ncbi:hypothetical protein Thiowin_04533 [Thiorhodovibrio winogradskyi]|uniref:Uncharacterized protein n=1 Tax=Thiorhodovibrio winogradskyi TaxID=77007 RepID=A0ABZ0SER6_9GAMM